MQIDISILQYVFIILVLVIIAVLSIRALVLLLLKSKSNFTGMVKHGKTVASVSIGKEKEEQDNKGKLESEQDLGKIGNHSVNKKLANPLTASFSDKTAFDINKLQMHRFFTATIYKFTSNVCPFNLYEETLRLGIKKDDKVLADFKKYLAAVYLHTCLFKILGGYVQEWVNKIINEVKADGIKKIPESFYMISQYIAKYKEAAYREGKSIELNFLDQKINGIPSKFMAKFNTWSDSNMNRIYTMISDVLYSAQSNWYTKTIELLDLFEVIFMILHDQMDATLIILNGEIEDFVEHLVNEKK